MLKLPTGQKNTSALIDGYVQLDDTQLYYQTIGEGPPLVFVHAGIADSRLWRQQRDTFADQYRVICYDLRGYGKSDPLSESFAHYRDLGHLLDTLNVDVAHFVGVSMGGVTAIDFALEQPDRVASLTLVEPAVGGYEFTDEAIVEGWEEPTKAYRAGVLPQHLFS